MEFLHANNDPNNPIDALRVNWYYRPRDIQRKVTDTRLVFASMHSDTCPLTSLRGKCRILNRNEIDNLDEYRKTKDCFWYEKLYDRYIQRYYEVIPTSQVINVPEHVKKVLDERWKFVIVEIGRGKELTSAVKNCRRCGGYCARYVPKRSYTVPLMLTKSSHDSVDCAVCRNTYHMNCVRPPLLKKPARGFAWACGPCSQAQERKLEARNTPILGESKREFDEEEEVFEEDDDEAILRTNSTGGSSPAPADREDGAPRSITASQIAQAKMWPYRYLGIHCRVEDALDYDDRIYPRASSRLGPRHQANVNIWHGRPVELVKPAEIKKKYIKGSSHKKDAKLSRETIAALEADKAAKERRPKWVMDEPIGYVHRGEDHANTDPANTAKLIFKMPEVDDIPPPGGNDVSEATQPGDREQLVDSYMTKVKGLAKEIGVKEYSTNYLDKALELLYANGYDTKVALEKLRMVNKRKDLKEPEFNKEEIKRFEEGVSKYGSEMRLVKLHVRTQKHADIVRFYYMWKKTDRGKQIWGNYEARKSKKQAKQVDANTAKLLDDVADDVDDSAFDNTKAAQRKRGFKCKFCSSRTSRQWRRAPNTAPGTVVPADSNGKSGKDKGAQLVLALCQRCAGLWRKYGIQFENVDEVAKKVAAGGGKASKKKIDVELLTELYAANEANSIGMSTFAVSTAASIGVSVSQSMVVQPGQEPSKKKIKVGEKDSFPPATNGALNEAPKKKVVEKVPEPPLIPEQPRPKVLPCAICLKMEPMGDQHLSCRDCRLTVHRNCYGVSEDRSASKWICDMCTNDRCTNDRGVQISTSYECVLCPVRYTEHEFVEPPKISHKKKSDREREKERLEREMALEAAEAYLQKQAELGRPLDPREALKRTAGNNWLHVVCAVWTPEIRFGNAKALAPSEGIGSIPTARYEQMCKVCKTSEGACVACHQCHAAVHVGCAHQAGYTFGFDVTPVKGSRRDTVNTVTLGSETGNATAAIWCKEHTVKTIVHPISEIVDNGSLNALQIFVRTYKQADLTLTGTVRKANLVSSSTRVIPLAVGSTSTRRSSAANGISSTLASGTTQSASRSSRISPAAVTVKSEEIDVDGDRVLHLSEAKTDSATVKHCVTCGTDASPKWHRSRKPRVGGPVAEQVPSVEGPAPDSVVNGCHRPHDVEISQGSEAVCRGQSTLSNGYSKDSEVDEKTVHAGPALRADRRIIPDPTASLATPFQCHKCHLKKPAEPSPEPTPPPPASIQPHIQQDAAPHVSNPPPPPPIQLTWPTLEHIVGQGQGHFQVWTNPTVSMQNGPTALPPNAPTQQPTAFAPSRPFHHIPLQQQTNGFVPPPQGVPPQYPAGAVAPYQLPRSGIVQLVPLRAPPAASHPGLIAQTAPHATNGVPLTHPPHQPHPPYQPPHMLNGQQGHRAAENPFTGPAQVASHSIPPLTSGHGSPHMVRDRPSTPMETGVIARPESTNRVVNGASASPSLRNLLS